MKKQIAVYLRLSQEDIDLKTNAGKLESESISAQRLLVAQALDAHEELRGVPRTEFCDDGYTGTSFDRPAFQRMIGQVKKGNISVIAVKDLSRFGRDYLEVGDYLEHIFPLLGVRVLSVNDGYDSAALAGRTGGMDVAFRNLIYESYSRDLSKKVLSAMGVRQKQAHYVSTVPYGYRRSPADRHALVPDELAAPVVRRIFLEIIAGKTTTEVAKLLNGEGIPSPAKYRRLQSGKPPEASDMAALWTHRGVLNILGNVKYTGVMVNHTRESRCIRDSSQRRVPPEEWIRRENAHEALVSQAEFNAAHEKLRSVKGGARSGHGSADCVYYCAYCGHRLRKTYGTDVYFTCATAPYQTDSPCAHIRLCKSEIEETVLAALKAQLALANVQKRAGSTIAIDRAAELCVRLQRLQAEAADCKKQKFHRYEDYHAGKLGADEYRAEAETLAERLRQLETEQSRLETAYGELIAAARSVGEHTDGIGAYSGYSDDELRAHLYDAVEKIVVTDNKHIEIIWKFSGQPLRDALSAPVSAAG